MGRLFNDENANLQNTGNLSLGDGIDDGAGHATYGYAKNDVTLWVPGWMLTSDTQPAMTYITGDIPVRALAASGTHKVAIPLLSAFNRSFAAAAGRTSNPHGVLVKSLALFYRVNTTTLTSFATMAINYTTFAAGSALPTVVAMTTTFAGNTLTAAANVYAAVATVTAPIWTPTTANDNGVWAVATIVTPGSSTCDLLGASWRVAYAMY